MRTKRGHIVSATALTVGSVILACLFGCPSAAPQPTFTQGAGSGDFGTLNDGQGNTFEIEGDGPDSFRVVANTAGGTGTIESDAQGRLTRLTTPGGADLNFQYNDDGSVTVTGTAVVAGNQVPVSFLIPENQIPDDLFNGAKLINQASPSNGPHFDTICEVITSFCNNLQRFLDILVPLAREIMIEEAGGNTGVALVDGAIAAGVDAVIASYVDQARDFCASWLLLDLVDAVTCE